MPAFVVTEIKKEDCILLTGKEGNDFMTKAMNVLVIEPCGTGIQQSLSLRGIKKRAEAEYLKKK